MFLVSRWGGQSPGQSVGRLVCWAYGRVAGLFVGWLAPVPWFLPVCFAYPTPLPPLLLPVGYPCISFSTRMIWYEDGGEDHMDLHTGMLPFAVLLCVVVVHVLVGHWIGWLVCCEYLGASYVCMCVCVCPFARRINPPPPHVLCPMHHGMPWPQVAFSYASWHAMAASGLCPMPIKGLSGERAMRDPFVVVPRANKGARI